MPEPNDFKEDAGKDLARLAALAEAAQDKKIEALTLSGLELELFVSIACHDLRVLLRKLLAYGEIVHNQAATADGVEAFERLQKSGRRMKAVLDSLSQFAKGSSAEKPLSPIDLGAALTSSLAEPEVELFESKAVIEAQPLPVIEADPNGMRFLFENLIGSSVRLRRTGQPPLIRIESRLLPDDRAEIKVQDNGIGFSQAYLDRLFQGFEPQPPDSDPQLIGVELAICRKIVKRHRGDISARCLPREGTEFLIRLPVKQAP